MKYNVQPTAVPEHLVPEVGEYLVIEHKEVKKEPLPPFTIVGNGFTNRHGTTSLDMLEVCLQMNQSEMKLFQFFRNVFTQNTIDGSSTPSIVEPLKYKEFDKYLATALMKNYKHMEYLQVLRRIKKGLYIINPKILIPSKHYIEMQMQWNNTKESHVDSV